MVLYVDETENEEYFIVAGLLVESESMVLSSYRRFKKKVKNYNIHKKFRARVFTEFKSTLLDNTYTRIKAKMVEEITTLEGEVIYSYYCKKEKKFGQAVKEDTYALLLKRIVSECKSKCDVVFDSFGKKDFEEKIILLFNDSDMVSSIRAGVSEREAGIQFIDNICSVIRLHLSKDKKDKFFKEIEHMTKEV